MYYTYNILHSMCTIKTFICVFINSILNLNEFYQTKVALSKRDYIYVHLYLILLFSSVPLWFDRTMPNNNASLLNVVSFVITDFVIADTFMTNSI